jgi:hypothetical protein
MAATVTACGTQATGFAVTAAAIAITAIISMFDKS